MQNTCGFVEKRTNSLQVIICMSGAFFKPEYLVVAQSIPSCPIHTQTTMFLSLKLMATGQ